MILQSREPALSGAEGNLVPRRHHEPRGAPCLASFARRGIPRPIPQGFGISTTGKGTTSVVPPAGDFGWRSASSAAIDALPLKPLSFRIGRRPMRNLLFCRRHRTLGCPMSRVFCETLDSTNSSPGNFEGGTTVKDGPEESHLSQKTRKMGHPAI
jgi:hypothetical protein